MNLLADNEFFFYNLFDFYIDNFVFTTATVIAY